MGSFTPRNVRREGILQFVLERPDEVMTGRGPTDEQVLWAASRRRKRFSTPTRLDAEVDGPPFHYIMPEEFNEPIRDVMKLTSNHQGRLTSNQQGRRPMGTPHAVGHISSSRGIHAISSLDRNISGTASANTKHPCGAGADSESSIRHFVAMVANDVSKDDAANCVKEFGKPSRHGEVHIESEASTDDGANTCAPSFSSERTNRTVSSSATACISANVACAQPLSPSNTQGRTFVLYHL